jgi:NAD(P)-dependent dehydrogenase (short-subunit alcohol dehydrogenase family)
MSRPHYRCIARIGRGIALSLPDLGHDLVINYAENTNAAQQTTKDCIALAQTCGKAIRAELCHADISKARRSGEALSSRKTFGRLDLLVNTPGSRQTCAPIS